MAAKSRAERARGALALALLVVCGLALRGWQLGWPPLWADEAESTINALTIVATGVPGDRYLGLPIYENVLVRPWPGSAEYAYRDVSYSERGLAVYHGWLPLYATAAVLRLAGVTPQAARSGTPVRDGSAAELVRWTLVPRIPALFFSALLVVAAFDLGRRTGGQDTAWALAMGSAVAGIFVWLGRQARYYSPTLALAAVCGAAVWTAWRRGLWRDHAWAGVALALLFHTHALSAVAAAALYAGTVPFARDRPRAARGTALGGLVAAGAVLPWAWWSGFLELRERIPAAHRLLDPSALVHSLPSSRPVVLAATGAGLALLALALLARRTPLAPRWTAAFHQRGPAIAFAAAWTLLAWATFVLLVPAASYFVLRLKLMVAVPGLLLVALLVSAGVRSALPAAPAVAPALALLALLAAAGQVPPPFPDAEAPEGKYEAARLVRSWRLSAGGRVYALPASQFALTYYSGVPVQNVSAVRGSWLDGFDGDLVVLAARAYEPLTAGDARKLALAHGRETDLGEAARLADEAVRRATLEDLAADGYDARPRLPPADAFERALVEATRAGTARFVAASLRGTPLPAGARFDNWIEFWEFYFFWFSDPAAHTGEGLNFRRRALRGTVHVLPRGWVVYDCRSRPTTPLVPDAP